MNSKPEPESEMTMKSQNDRSPDGDGGDGVPGLHQGAATAEAEHGHTPGPWELDYDKGSTRDILSRKHGGICTVRRAGRHDGATFLANARLIASAPELLDALIEMLDASKRPVHERWYANVQSVAAAAIAKATKGTS